MTYMTKKATRDLIIFIAVVLLSCTFFAFAQDSIYVRSVTYVLAPASYPTPDTIRFKIKYKNKTWLAYSVEYDEDKKLATINLLKPLHSGYYTAKKLTKLGYPCKFKGSVFMTYERYLELVNNKSITK